MSNKLFKLINQYCFENPDTNLVVSENDGKEIDNIISGDEISCLRSACRLVELASIDLAKKYAASEQFIQMYVDSCKMPNEEFNSKYKLLKEWTMLEVAEKFLKRA